MLVFHLKYQRALRSQAAKLAEENGFKSATFCPINKWKEEGNETRTRARRRGGDLLGWNFSPD